MATFIDGRIEKKVPDRLCQERIDHLLTGEGWNAFCFDAGSKAHFVDSGSVTLHICEQAHESRMASLHRLYGSSDILPPFSRLGISVSASDADVIDEVMPAAIELFSLNDHFKVDNLLRFPDLVFVQKGVWNKERSPREAERVSTFRGREFTSHAPRGEILFNLGDTLEEGANILKVANLASNGAL